MGKSASTTTMCVLLMGSFLSLLAAAEEVQAAPQQKATEVTPERGTYSPLADIGQLAGGATGFLGQFWNTGVRLGGELSRRTFGLLQVKK
uniref:Secreted protein n=1 Tax=Anopheles dirus TaxID=7168 RepID=A0A182NJ01_9DIPT